MYLSTHPFFYFSCYSLLLLSVSYLQGSCTHPLNVEISHVSQVTWLTLLALLGIYADDCWIHLCCLDLSPSSRPITYFKGSLAIFTCIPQSDLKWTCPQLKTSFSQNLLSLHMLLNLTNGKAQKMVKSSVAQGRNLGFILDFFLSLIFPADIKSTQLSPSLLSGPSPGHLATGWLW